MESLYGMAMEGSNNNTISYNIISNAYLGAYLLVSANNTISDNIITNTTESGIYFDTGCSNNTVVHNIIADALGDGIDDYSDYKLIADNNITDAWNYGIGLKEVNNDTIVGNMIINSISYGIFLTDCSDTIVYANVLIGNNGAALTSDGSPCQAYDDNDNQWNTTMGNYWGDWQSPDEDHNGIVICHTSPTEAQERRTNCQ